MMARVIAGRAATGNPSAEGFSPAALVAGHAPPEPDYIARNRSTWDRWAPSHVSRGRAAWVSRELLWGLWDTPESRIQLLRDVAPGADAVELGCGTAAISSWLARLGRRPVAVDFSEEQLRSAAHFQDDFSISFPLVHANAEAVPYDDESFDIAISEYGASLWCDPRRWLPEAHRLLRPGGCLVFFTNASFLMACTSELGGAATDVLARSYFAPYRVEFPDDEAVEFHLTHGHWIRFLRTIGFVLDDLLEIRPPLGANPRFGFVSLGWARRWPSEEIWIARKPG